MAREIAGAEPAARRLSSLQDLAQTLSNAIHAAEKLEVRLARVTARVCGPAPEGAQGPPEARPESPGSVAGLFDQAVELHELLASAHGHLERLEPVVGVSDAGNEQEMAR